MVPGTLSVGGRAQACTLKVGRNQAAPRSSIQGLWVPLALKTVGANKRLRLTESSLKACPGWLELRGTVPNLERDICFLDNPQLRPRKSQLRLG
ncbi:hypothetical protein P7K49_017170 [Saguinus oedipus]|uniref:Uncharacterized protein n=1 Tax=Saguinus oedipus TaxID=9490 RepID=A0ABQ9V2U3_SAGOE|nr:hypothetical protein P7K49_017170 [Saguinus oedipus]